MGNYLPAFGSMAAQDALRTAMTLYRLAEAAFDADPMDEGRAVHTDRCWAEVAIHALNCGASGREDSLEQWVVRRLGHYARSIGRTV